jgi:hypothetical protein
MTDGLSPTTLLGRARLGWFTKVNHRRTVTRGHPLNALIVPDTATPSKGVRREGEIIMSQWSPTGSAGSVIEEGFIIQPTVPRNRIGSTAIITVVRG